MPRHFDGGEGNSIPVRMWIIQSYSEIFLFYLSERKREKSSHGRKKQKNPKGYPQFGVE